MNLLCVLLAASLLLSLSITPLVRNLFRKLDLVDRPDAGRKAHPRPVPRIGGIPIVLAYIGALGLALAFGRGVHGRMLHENLWLVWKLLPAFILVFFIGLADDLIGLKPWQKLLAQFVAAAWVYAAGVRILAIHDHGAHWWSLPLTIIWLAACSNAFNLIDGLDGLAAGIGLVATLTIILAAIMQGNYPLAVVTVPLAGSLLGFIYFNFNPASIFLGDCGSLIVGFLLGCFGIIWSQKSATLLGMTAPLMAFIVPMLDVALSIARRYMRRKPIFSADSGHIHHRLLALGLKPKGVSLVLYAVCGIGAALSLVASVITTSFEGIVLVLFCAFIWFGVRRLKYTEFGIAQKMFFAGDFRKVLTANIRLQIFRDALVHARTFDECWPTICDTCREFGFSYIVIEVRNKHYEQRLIRRPGPSVEEWKVSIDISPDCRITIRHPLNSPFQAMVAVPLLEAMHRYLPEKEMAAYDAPRPANILAAAAIR